MSNRYAHIYWATDELDAEVKRMAADDMDSVSRFVSKLVAKEIERRLKARTLVDSREPYRAGEEA